MSKLVRKLKNSVTGLAMKPLQGLERKERNRRQQEKWKRQQENTHHPLAS